MITTLDIRGHIMPGGQKGLGEVFAETMPTDQ